MIISIKQEDENNQMSEDKYLCERFIGVMFDCKLIGSNCQRPYITTGTTITVRNTTDEDENNAVKEIQSLKSLGRVF